MTPILSPYHAGRQDGYFPPLEARHDEVLSFADAMIERDLWSAMQAAYQRFGKEAARAKVAELILDLDGGMRK